MRRLRRWCAIPFIVIGAVCEVIADLILGDDPHHTWFRD